MLNVLPMDDNNKKRLLMHLAFIVWAFQVVQTNIRYNARVSHHDNLQGNLQ